MNAKKIVYAVHKVFRQQPQNFQEKHLHLFEKVFSAEINETSVLCLKNISILKDNIFNWRNLKFYTAYSHILKVSPVTIWGKLYLFFKKSHTIDNGIWITDEWSAEYFHWFTDALPRLFAAETIGYNYPIILPARYAQIPYIQASLELLNITASYYNPRKRVLVKSLILPSHTAATGNYNVQIISQVRDRFLQSNREKATKKIYVSRRKANKRKVLNEEAVIDLLLQYGYQPYCFEDYTLTAQIAIMSEVKTLVGLHGAGLTNMLFMPQKGQILELRKDQDAFNNCYFVLAAALDHDYYYLTNTGNSSDTYHVDITVDIDELNAVIKSMEL